MPRLESEFENKDIVGEQFRDMEEAICFLAKSLKDISDGKVKDAPKYAKESMSAVLHIWAPFNRLKFG